MLPKVLVGTLCTVLALWTIDQAMHNVREIRRENSFAENTRDLSAPRWLGSETLHHIRRNPLHGVVFSNQQEVVYFNNAGKSKYSWLRSHDHRHDLSFRHEKGIISSLKDGAYIVWFRDWDNHFPFGETQMRITPGLVQLVSLADGTIFQRDQGHVPPNPYQRAYRLTIAGMLGTPSARSIYDVYRADRTLTYVKQPCLPQDTKAPFFLHLTVATVASSGPGSENRVAGGRFNFWEAGTMLDGADGEESNTCVAIAELPPNLPIEHVRTGQVGDRTGWSVEINMAA